MPRSFASGSFIFSLFHFFICRNYTTNAGFSKLFQQINCIFRNKGKIIGNTFFILTDRKAGHMKKIVKWGFILFLTYAFTAGYGTYRQVATAEGIAGKIIRFHIIANSDTAADQELKLKVRDAIGSYMQQKLSKATDISQSRQVIRENLREIEAQAHQAIAAEGFSYPVKAELKKTDFPEKTYGDYTFQAGRYEALEVVIGNGEGHNWWCVMYPNLCFFNSTYEVVDQKAEESLEHVLTREEYKSLMEQKNYKVKFALLEWIMEKF